MLSLTIAIQKMYYGWNRRALHDRHLASLNGDGTENVYWLWSYFCPWLITCITNVHLLIYPCLSSVQSRSSEYWQKSPEAIYVLWFQINDNVYVVQRQKRRPRKGFRRIVMILEAKGKRSCIGNKRARHAYQSISCSSMTP